MTKQVAIISPLDDTAPFDLSSFKFHLPRYGSVAVASHLAAHGYRARVLCEHSHQEIDWDFVRAADYVAFSLLSFCAPRGYELVRRVRAITKAPLIIGGNHASVQPEDAAQHADYVVRNEGEATLLALLQTLDAGGDPTALAGLSYRAPDGRVVHNPDREFMDDLDVVTDYRLVPGYGPVRWFGRLGDLARRFMPYVHLPFVMASRGCPYGCRFCFTRRELGTRLRLRDPEIVLREIEGVVRLTGSRIVWFADADFLLSRAHAAALLERMAARLSPRTEFIVFTRSDVAEDADLLERLKQARVTHLCIGAESINRETLAQFNKGLDPDTLFARTRRLRAAGFRVYLSFIFGGEGDTVDEIRTAVDRSVDADVSGIGLHPLYDFPNQSRVPNREQSIADRRFIHHDWRYYTGNFVVFFPRRMRPSQLQRAIRDGALRFFERQPSAMYEYRPVFLTFDRYLPFLQAQEDALYGRDDCLLDERLDARDPAAIREVPIDLTGLPLRRHALTAIFRSLARPAAWRAAWRYGVEGA